MKNWAIFLIIIVSFLGLLVISSMGATGGGDITDPSYYCRTLLTGNLIGDNLVLGELECGSYPYPASLLQFEARLFGGDKAIKCQTQVDNNAFGDEKNIGDLGFSEEAWYNFKISHIELGQHKVTVRCQGDSEAVSRTYNFGVFAE